MISDPRHVRYFLAVAEELHFRRAALRLGVAQPALSRAIRDLEVRLGLQLFIRNNRVVTLTPAGKTLAREWAPVLERVERGERRAKEAEQGRHGVVTIAYTDLAISGVLPKLIQLFSARYPDVRIATRHAVTWRQVEALSSGNLDLGFLTGPVETAEFDCLPVESNRCVAIAPKDHWIAERQAVTLGELADESFILGNEQDWQHFHAYIYGECSRVGFAPRVVQRAFNSVGILGLIAAGMGITVNCESARNFLHPELVIRPISDFRVTIPTLAAWSRKDAPPTALTFVEFLRRGNAIPFSDAVGVSLHN